VGEDALPEFVPRVWGHGGAIKRDRRGAQPRLGRMRGGRFAAK
jgi:hypothetical protein